MGAVLAKFRKEQSTEKKLELIEEKIQALEKYTYNTQETKKRFVGTFLAVSVGVYVIAAIAIIYFVYFPRTWKDRCLYIVPLLIFPFLIIWLRRLFTWYFQRKLNKNADKLTTLREEKRKILDQVMDKETYKVAVNLLARFGGVSNNSSRLSFGGQRTNASPYVANNQALRTLATKPANNNQLATASPLPAANQQMKPSPFRPATSQQQQLTTRTSQSLTATPINRTDQQLRRRTPFPIVNHAEKSFLERCLDVIIGDGPQDRFAVICRECYCHNGMALKEEFDYIAYRCAFCNALNPARKTRPIAPRLSLPAPSSESSPRFVLHDSDSSASTRKSESTDDESDENNERRVQLRLTESTANQSESPEISNHENKQSTDSTLALSEKHISEPMDVVEEEFVDKLAGTLSSNDDHEAEKLSPVPMDIIKDDDVSKLPSTLSSNNDARKKVD